MAPHRISGNTTPHQCSGSAACTRISNYARYRYTDMAVFPYDGPRTITATIPQMYVWI